MRITTPTAMVAVASCGRPAAIIEKRRPAVSEPTSQYAQTKGLCINSFDQKSPLNPNVISKKIAVAATEIPSDACHVLFRNARKPNNRSDYGKNSEAIKHS